MRKCRYAAGHGLCYSDAVAAVQHPAAALSESSGVQPSSSEPVFPPTLSEVALYPPRTRKWALVIVVVLSLIGAATVAAPLWIPILFGVVMAISAHRPYRALARKIRDRQSLAAGLVTLAAGLIVAVAGTLVVVALTNELMKLVAHLNERGSSGLIVDSFGPRLTTLATRLGVDTAKLSAWAESQVEAAATFAASTAAVVLRTTSETFLGLVVALMTMYYMLIEGAGLARRFERILPLEPRHTRALLLEARDVGHTAFLGTIATAIVQGFLAGIGYAVLGVPQPVTWAIVTFLASFLPVIGTLIVWVPISGWFFMTGHPVRALIMIAWGVVVVTSIADYFIRPRLVGVRGHGHPLLTLISLLGGIEIFGLAGLIVAPIFMSVFVAALRLYEREVRLGGIPGMPPMTADVAERAPSAPQESPAIPSRSV